MRELKALELLKAVVSETFDTKFDSKTDEEVRECIFEAIKELEELNNRSCLNCIFAYRDKNKKIDDIQGQVLGSKARWSYCKKLMLNVTKDFCCNRYEAKGE